LLLFFAKHSLDSISLEIVNRQRWVMCLYKWPWTLHSCGWSLYEWQTTRKRKPGLRLVSMWTQPQSVCSMSGFC